MSSAWLVVWLGWAVSAEPRKAQEEVLLLGGADMRPEPWLVVGGMLWGECRTLV